MADSTQADTNILSLGLLVLAVITLIPGLVIHSFIIGIDVNDWWKGRSVTSVDHILTSLGISRMNIQGAFTMYVFVDILFQSRLNLEAPMLIIDAVHVFFTHANVWLTSLLSIVFCLKISNLRTRLFLYLRRMILPRTGHFIVALGLLSAFSSLMTLFMVNTEVTDGGAYNATKSNLITVCGYTYALYYFFTGASISLLCSFISSVLLFCSLYHHTVKMKRSSNLSINLEAYYSAMKFVSFTFIYNTIYLFGHFACGFYYLFNCVDFTWPFIFLGFLPVLHSSYLIHRTTKLRQQMSNILWNATDFILQRKDTKNRENIEVIDH
ncbi:taste receptor type 2 member 7-like [Anomaloglossus baeobatrachus]|uniref:taste receptor type 2 member 7-like n=1 Tax=Anomaloglossus baeobatrachus TaxID=238106 RepID=UPI003F504C70